MTRPKAGFHMTILTHRRSTAAALLAASLLLPAPTLLAGPPQPESARERAGELSRAFRDAARRLAPSVVTIKAGSRGIGTGVVVSRDGHIATANHVVAGADGIEIVLHDGRTAAATVVGLDPGTDLAVLRTDAGGLEPASFGDSSSLEPGEWVVAIGAPFGLDQTVTAGIVSAKGRSDVGLAAFESYIQTDAAINPGNSGGPLANLDGEIIGINSAISSRSGGNDGIGFAVPSAVVRRVTDAIIASGRVARGYLGIGVQPADDEMLAGLGAGARRGVLVNRVERDSPAARAGLAPGDLITEIDGVAVRTPGELIAAVGGLAPGREISLASVRNGDEQRLRATLAERQDDDAPRAEAAKLGLSLRLLDERDAKAAGATDGSGAVVVESADPSGAAALAGIRAGDLIRRIGTREIRAVADAHRAIAEAPDNGALAMLVERAGAARFVLVRPIPADKR
ncbi:MAG: hypothetical protein RIT24_3081 [Planctomycetota bacterium]